MRVSYERKYSSDSTSCGSDRSSALEHDALLALAELSEMAPESAFEIQEHQQQFSLFNERTSKDRQTDRIVASHHRDVQSERKKSRKVGSRKKLSRESTAILDHWISLHQESPYPSAAEKQAMADESGLSVKQVSDYLGNYRKRVWNPPNMDLSD